MQPGLQTKSSAAGRSTRVIIWVLAACILIAPGSCTLKPEPLPAAGDRWQYHDLHALADPDAHTIIAAYSRQTQTDLEIRVDLLDVPDQAEMRLLLALDTHPGGKALSFAPDAGAEWDLLVSAPFHRVPDVISLTGRLPQDFRARVALDIPDSIIVRLPSRSTLKQQGQDGFRFIAFITPSDSSVPKDAFGPIQSDAAPPPQAPLLLAFWDTFPSATPAQALRRWDGAHTGPYGQRHGLSILLEATRRSKIPVALLDLKQPKQLSVLALMGGLETVQSLQKDGLLILPDAAYSRLSGQNNLNAAQRWFGLPDSPLVYGTASGDLLGKYSGAFAWLNDPTHIAGWNNSRLIPLPEPSDQPEIDENGLSSQLRARLVQTALSPDPDDLIVVGGALPRSPWGDLINVNPAMDYMTNHPWIKVLDQKALLTLPAQPGQPRCADLLCQPQASLNLVQDTLRSALDQAPPGLFANLARQTYLALTQPQADQRLAALQSIYLGDTGYLTRAAQWAANPVNLSTCSEDLDFDGTGECILASQRVFLIFSPLGGRLVFAAYQTGSEPVQIIGPRSQLAVGLGDTRDLKLENGLAADPQEISGAFVDYGASGIAQDAYLPYDIDLQSQEISLTRPDSGLQKKFTLNPDGFQVEINSGSPVDTTIPFILLNSKVNRPDWLSRYQAAEPASTAWAWGLEGGSCIRLSASDAEMTVSTFFESRSMLKDPENPDLVYPEGHFLPFPMAVVTLHSPGSFSLNFRITPFQENFAGLALGRSCVQQP